MSKYLPSGIYQLNDDCKYNARYKYITSKDGSVTLCEEMFTKRFIFNPHHVEEHGKDARLHRERWNAQLDEMYGRDSKYKADKLSEAENIARSKRRAKSHLLDFALCNEFECFVTLTLDMDKIDRTNYNAVIKKLNTWLDNRVRRKGLCYVGVPELHKDGAVHFHILCNDVLEVVDSGTVIRPTGGRPVKQATAKKQGFNLADCRTVYNIPDWTLGFSTMYYTYGDVRAVANYVVKYITKGEKKVGGRWYYSGGDLLTPLYKYDRVDFDEVKDYDYDFECDGGSFKIKNDFTFLGK